MMSYLIIAVLTALSSLIVYLIVKLNRSEKRALDIKEKLTALEIRTAGHPQHLKKLEASLSPHLLNNILNSIQSHAYQTYFSLHKLSNVLDYLLYESRNRLVSPKEEIEFAMNLIEINKIKVSPLFELNVKNKVDETDPLYTQSVLAPLISIDLIENAFKHADLQSGDAFISIVFELKDGMFLLTVSNKISKSPVMKKTKGGIGSDTLEQRLNIIYHNQFVLDRFIEEDVYIAHLKIKLLDHQTQMHTAR